MKILVTGNLGFIGRRLTDVLIENNTIIPYDLVNGDDIRDICKLDKVFEMERPDIVIHLAALANPRRSENYPDDYISTNIKGTYNIVKMCEKYDVNHLINFSSSSVYGSLSEKPLKEDDPKTPRSVYAVTKLAAEKIVNYANIPTTTIRPFTVYGENGRKDQVLYKWINAYNEDKCTTVFAKIGEHVTSFPKRGYTYVGDLINGVIRIIQVGQERIAMHKTYNLGGDMLVSNKELLDLFPADIKYDIEELPSADPMCNQADTKKAKRELGWEATTNFNIKAKEIINNDIN